VSIRKLRMRHYWFPIRKRGFLRPGKEIEGLCGGVHWYAAQASPKIDATRAEKDRFRMETKNKEAIAGEIQWVANGELAVGKTFQGRRY
jgi:hypothetical protein